MFIDLRKNYLTANFLAYPGSYIVRPEGDSNAKFFAQVNGADLPIRAELWSNGMGYFELHPMQISGTVTRFSVVQRNGTREEWLARIQGNQIHINLGLSDWVTLMRVTVVEPISRFDGLDI